MFKKVGHLMMLLGVSLSLKAQDILPTLPVGQTEAESGDFFGWMIIVGKWTAIVIMSGILIWITVAFGSGVITDFFDWYKGRKEGTELTGRTIIGLVFMLFIYIVMIFAMGWIRSYTIDVGGSGSGSGGA